MPIIKSLWNRHLWSFLAVCLIFNFSCSSSGNRKKIDSLNHSTTASQPMLDKTSFNKKSDGLSSVISVVTWNLSNFGYSKKDNKIEFIAKVIKDYDIIAIQEVVGKSGGADAIIRLVNQLNDYCPNCQWNYEISKLTSGTPHRNERYAFLWKGNILSRKGLGRLENNYSEEIEREPFLLTFVTRGNKEFTLVNFHALPKSSQPETEIKYFKFLPQLYPDDLLIFLGDFNLPQSHSVFNPLKKMGYRPALIGQKTSLRQKCINDDCLASEYDNIFYPASKINFIESNIIHFYKEFKGDMIGAREISDHVPVFLKFKIAK